MKKSLILLCIVAFTTPLFAQLSKNIELPKPNLERGVSLMKALSLRQSAKKFDAEKINVNDLSDLLWAANGINRPESGKRTAPSALNAQDIDIYVFNEDGAYLYDAQAHTLNLIVSDDKRSFFSRNPLDSKPSTVFLLVSDISRFKFGKEEQRLEWAAMDAGIVSQNILLFCASEDLLCRPRAGMKKDKISELLNLSDSQYPMLNVPVSYKTK